MAVAVGRRARALTTGRARIARTASADAANDAASTANARPVPSGDEPAAEHRADQPERDRSHELVERVGRGEVVGRQQVGDDRLEGRREERGPGAVKGDQRDELPQLERVGEYQHREQVTATARTTSAHSISSRRSWRSLRTPPSSRNTTVGTVIPMPTIESAAGAFQRTYASQAIAIRKMPSPTSETVMPLQSTRKSRWRSGDSRRARSKPPGRSSAS